MKELQTFRGHEKEVCCASERGVAPLIRSALAWHPTQHDLLTSGGSDGSLFHWTLDSAAPRAAVKNAHESNIWSLAYHPLGVRRRSARISLTRQHTLASGGNDHALRWVRRQSPDASLTRRSGLAPDLAYRTRSTSSTSAWIARANSARASSTRPTMSLRLYPVSAAWGEGSRRSEVDRRAFGRVAAVVAMGVLRAASAGLRRACRSRLGPRTTRIPARQCPGRLVGRSPAWADRRLLHRRSSIVHRQPTRKLPLDNGRRACSPRAVASPPARRTVRRRCSPGRRWVGLRWAGLRWADRLRTARRCRTRAARCVRNLSASPTARIPGPLARLVPGSADCILALVQS